jgi:hypothetical protein
MSETVKVMGVDESKTMPAVIGAHLKGSSFEIVARSETMKRLLDADNAFCVIMVSSMGTQKTVQVCLKMGAKIFLQKLLMKNRMLAMLNNVCQDAGVAL